MTLKVKLDHIIEGLEVQSNETHSYLNKKTGMVELIDDEYMSVAEEKRNRKR